MKAKRAKVDFDLVRSMALELPDVAVQDSARGPSVKVRGKLMACPAIHKSAEPETLMVRIGKDERAKMISDDPETYYVTDHYRNYPALLVRLSRISRESLEELLGLSWKFVFEKSAGSASK